MLFDRLTITGLFLLGYSAIGSEIILTPADTSSNYTLNETLVSARYTMPTNGQINGFEIMVRSLDLASQSALAWSITGSTAQDGYITVANFLANPNTADAQGFKLFTFGQPYASTAGSFESLTLSASTGNVWQIKTAVSNNSFNLKPIAPQPVPEASTATLGAIGLIASVIAFVFRRYQNAH